MEIKLHRTSFIKIGVHADVMRWLFATGTTVDARYTVLEDKSEGRKFRGQWQYVPANGVESFATNRPRHRSGLQSNLMDSTRAKRAPWKFTTSSKSSAFPTWRAISRFCSESFIRRLLGKPFFNASSQIDRLFFFFFLYSFSRSICPAPCTLVLHERIFFHRKLRRALSSARIVHLHLN